MLIIRAPGPSLAAACLIILSPLHKTHSQSALRPGQKNRQELRDFFNVPRNAA